MSRTVPPQPLSPAGRGRVAKRPGEGGARDGDGTTPSPYPLPDGERVLARARLAQAVTCLRVALAALTLTATSALAQGAAQPSAEPGMSQGRRFTEEGGQALYANVCAACHQPDAKGAIGAAAYPALAGNEKLVSAGYPLTILLYGLRGMPPVGRMMNDQQVADVVNYVRTHFGNSYDDPVSAADVKAVRP